MKKLILILAKPVVMIPLIFLALEGITQETPSNENTNKQFEEGLAKRDTTISYSFAQLKKDLDLYFKDKEIKRVHNYVFLPVSDGKLTDELKAKLSVVGMSRFLGRFIKPWVEQQGYDGCKKNLEFNMVFSLIGRGISCKYFEDEVNQENIRGVRSKCEFYYSSLISVIEFNKLEDQIVANIHIHCK